MIGSNRSPALRCFRSRPRRQGLRQGARESARPGGRKGFFGFLLPLRAAETLGGRGVPADGFGRARRPSHESARVQTRPWRRACVRTTRRVDREDPRWFAPCGCVPGFVANRSLAGIVSVARKRGQRYTQKSAICATAACREFPRDSPPSHSTRTCGRIET